MSPGLPECIEQPSERELRARMLEYPCPPKPAGELHLQAEEVFAEGSQVPGQSLNVLFPDVFTCPRSQVQLPFRVRQDPHAKILDK